MPAKVDKLFDEVKEKNPSYSDAQAWATAWSIYCRYVKPDSKSCHLPTSEYLKGKSATYKIAAQRVVARYLRKASKASGIADGSVVVYRGARGGNVGAIRGPAYFATAESFAKTYGPTTAYRLKLRDPYLCGPAEWSQFANSSFNPTAQVKEALARQSELDGVRYDSVIADFGPVQAVLVLDAAKTATPEV